MEVGKVRYGKCLNFGNCKIANEKKVVEVDSMEDFVCPECGTELAAMANPVKKTSKGLLYGVVVAAVLLVGVGAYFFLRSGEKEEVAIVESSVSVNVEKPVDVPASIAVEGVLLDVSAVELTVGGSQTLTASIQPANATVKKVTWTSTMPDVVSVDADGVVKGILEGNAVIRVTSEDGSYSADCKVTVKKGQAAQASKNELKFPYGKYVGETKNGKAHGTGTLYFDKSSQISKNDDKKRMAESGDYVTGEFFEGELVQGKWFDKANKQKSTLLIGRAQ